MMNSRNKFILVLSLFTCFVLFFISNGGVQCSNDGSHIALVKSIVENNTVKIDHYINYTRFIDYSDVMGHYYSDRVPGTAFITLPFYYYGKFLNNICPAYFNKFDNLEEVTSMLLPALAGMFIVFLLFKIFIVLNFSFNISLFTALCFAFASTLWTEAARLFSHSLSMLTILYAVYIVLSNDRLGYENKNKLYLVFLTLSISSIIEIQNILFFPIFAFYLIKSKKLLLIDFKTNKMLRVFFCCGVIFILIYSVLIVYNYEAFGELTIKSNKYNPNFPEELSFLSSLSGNLFKGLDNLFFSFSNLDIYTDLQKGINNLTPGLFVSSPIFLFSIFGFVKILKKYKYETLFFLALIIVIVLIAAFHKETWLRHMATVIPLLFIPIIYQIENIKLKCRKKEKSGYLLSVIFFVFLIISIFRNAYLVFNSFDVTEIFAGFKNLPILIVFVFMAIPLFLIIYKLYKTIVKRRINQ